MRIFVGEYVCGGGLTDTHLDQIPSCLRLEGAAMLRALVSDVSQVAQSVVPVDPRFAPPLDSGHCVEINGETSVWRQWAAAAADCDHAIIVAPESDGTLAKGVGMLRALGVDVIASSGDFLRVASDKSLTAKVLQSAGVAQPMVITSGDRRHAEACRAFDRFVVKPIDGCGTQAIRTFNSFEDATAALTEGLIMQPWIEGRPVSISLIASGSQQIFLPAVSQSIAAETCEYGGGQGPLDDDVQRRAAALASRAIAAMPPTAKGFVGLDLLIGNRPSEDYVIEINPRLTTSYVGLRQMINGNLAARLLDLECGPVSCCVHQDEVRWTPDGKVWVNELASAAE